MQIKIISLSLLNFKGIRQLTVNFNNVTNISGRNKLGKTTIFDAFLWLLFGKDSFDRKDFSIKTLDKDNEPFHRLDHEVTGILEVDGDRVEIRRLLQENWVAKRGSKDKEFKGHTTSFFWNNVPMQLQQYQDKINEILKEDVFKLLTNTGYFNSKPWQDRRQVLISIAGNISNEDIFDRIITPGNKENFTELINALNAKKSVDEFRREILGKKKRIKEEMEGIPGRIDEANRSLPDPLDYDGIQLLLDAAKAGLTETENLLMNKTQAQKNRQTAIGEKLKLVQQHNREITTISNQVTNDTRQAGVTRQSEITGLELQVRSLNNEIDLMTREYTTEAASLERLIAQKEEIGTKWDKVNAETLEINEAELCCPTCKRQFDEGTVETKKTELQSNFNQDKSRRLGDITTKGQQLAEDIKTKETALENLKTKGAGKRSELNLLETKLAGLREAHANKTNEEDQIITQAIADHQDIRTKQQLIDQINKEIDAPTDDQEDNSVLLQTKSELNTKISTYTGQLATKDIRTKTEARIKELTEQESTMGTELASLEGIEFSIEQFVKAKMDELESRINGRFKMVKFKLFKKQINEGEVECCDTLIDGVPYADANTASRINAGIDIINTLSEHYQVFAPVFVDNAESVNTLIPLNSQLIRLVVSLDEKLKIESSAA